MDAEARLVELETRLAFQENALAELGEEMARMRIENARYADLLRRTLEELKASRGAFYADPATEPPPPHY
ncbi:MAG: SlyX family protein [Lysobacteraceae bacterium]